MGVGCLVEWLKVLIGATILFERNKVKIYENVRELVCERDKELTIPVQFLKWYAAQLNAGSEEDRDAGGEEDKGELYSFMNDLGGNFHIVETEEDFNKMLETNVFFDNCPPDINFNLATYNTHNNTGLPEEALKNWWICVYINNNAGGPAFIYPASMHHLMPKDEAN